MTLLALSVMLLTLLIMLLLLHLLSMAIAFIILLAHTQSNLLYSFTSDSDTSRTITFLVWSSQY